MFRVAFWIVSGIVVIAALIVVIGWRLPKEHSASRTTRVNMPPDALYALLVDIDHYRSWRSDVTRLERLPDRDGHPAWVEATGNARIAMYFERMERPSLLVGRIADPTLPFGGTWTYRIAPWGAGSELTIMEDGVVYNPVFRFMSRFVFGYYGTMDAFIANLHQRAGAL